MSDIPWFQFALRREYPKTRELLERNPLKRPRGVLSLRTAREGGKLADAVSEVSNGVGIRNAKSATILIHGYNVTKRWADIAYANFVKDIDTTQLGEMYWVYWPGDYSSNGVVATAAYTEIVKRMDKIAEKLSAHIGGSTLKTPLKLRVIAHSLGCRVALETLDRLHRRGATGDVRPNRIDHVALMAAAVARFRLMGHVHEDDDLRKPISRAKSAHIYRSYHDRVLASVFRPGQMFEAKSTKTKHAELAAVGRRGISGDRRNPGTAPAGLGSAKDTITILGHGEYWDSRPVRGTIKSNLPTNRRLVVGRGVEPRNVDPTRVDPVTSLFGN